jgi:hypothetical protein
MVKEIELGKLPCVGPSWINNYVGMGFNGDMMRSDSIVIQYMISSYWVAATAYATNGAVSMIPLTTMLEVRCSALQGYIYC